MITVLGMKKGWFWYILCHKFKPLTEIYKFKILKPCRTVSGQFNLIKNFAETFLQQNAQPHIWKHRKRLKNLKWTLLPHPPHSPDLATFHLFGALKDAILRKKFGMMTMLMKKWRSGCEYKIQTGTRRGQMHLFLTGARLNLMEVMKKHDMC
jgi:hypothetical protein